MDGREDNNSIQMKLVRILLLVAFAGTAFAVAELPKSLADQLRKDVTQALTKNGEQPSKSDVDDAMREASTSADKVLHFNPGALAEYESGESSISAVALQEVVNDFEFLAGDMAVPKLITFYIARSKVEVLSARQRILCYVMIKSAMRHIRAAQEEK